MSDPTTFTLQYLIETFGPFAAVILALLGFIWFLIRQCASKDKWILELLEENKDMAKDNRDLLADNTKNLEAFRALIQSLR